ncbi:hypothetical protein FOA52_012553 [Chlamydomonas sp. UWO 241]|nr:hypothetical protein FOA52_012553 [Chlamydomonas sp. UWO 241]
MSAVFEVVLFTAARQQHADAVLARIDPSRSLIHHRLYGHHATATPQWAWVKDLSRLGRDLSQTLIVDDCPAAALLQPANWVSIAGFSQGAKGWRADGALRDVGRFLTSRVLHAPDTRAAIARYYNVPACRPLTYVDALCATLQHAAAHAVQHAQGRCAVRAQGAQQAEVADCEQLQGLCEKQQGQQQQQQQAQRSGGSRRAQPSDADGDEGAATDGGEGQPHEMRRVARVSLQLSAVEAGA